MKIPVHAYFDAKTFVQAGSEEADGEWSDEDKKGIENLRELYPELAHWGNLPIGCAFGDFSQDVLEVNWADWMLLERDELFLNYCCWKQTLGAWNCGLDGNKLKMASEWKTI